MKKRRRNRSFKETRSVAASKKRIGGFWVQLPKSVVKARAGLIPSDETDACPPPEGLATADLLAWYRGLPVFCNAVV